MSVSPSARSRLRRRPRRAADSSVRAPASRSGSCYSGTAHDELSSRKAADLAYARRGGRYERSACDRPSLRPLGGGFRGVDRARLLVHDLLLGAQQVPWSFVTRETYRKVCGCRSKVGHEPMERHTPYRPVTRTQSIFTVMVSTFAPYLKRRYSHSVNICVADSS